MFQTCQNKSNGTCPFAGFSRWDPVQARPGSKESLYCGLATGIDTRVDTLPECWADMSSNARMKHRDARERDIMLGRGYFYNDRTNKWILPV